MNTQSRYQKILNSIKRSVVGTIITVLLLAIAGTIYQTAAAEADQRNFPAPGNLIDVGGFKMHLYCVGEGSPTVILETLSGGTSSYWGWVQPEVAKTTRVCVYDRAGRGWSESDPEPISLTRTVRNLHTLLVNAHIDGPYILVGHSIGGIYVRQYAADYPDEIVGMVLVDAGNPEQFDRYPEMLEESVSYLRLSATFPTLARLGIWRIYFAAGGDLDFGELTEPQKSELKAVWSSPEYFVSQRAEVLAGPDIFSNGQKLGTLGDLPLIVLTAGRGATTGWIQLRNELTSLSDTSIHLTIKEATHTSFAFNQNDAHQVSLAIAKIIGIVQTGKRYSP